MKTVILLVYYFLTMCLVLNLPTLKNKTFELKKSSFSLVVHDIEYHFNIKLLNLKMQPIVFKILQFIVIECVLLYCSIVSIIFILTKQIKTNDFGTLRLCSKKIDKICILCIIGILFATISNALCIQYNTLLSILFTTIWVVAAKIYLNKIPFNEEEK